MIADNGSIKSEITPASSLRVDASVSRDFAIVEINVESRHIETDPATINSNATKLRAAIRVHAFTAKKLR